ncbi:hypothetical protein ACSBR2_037192 [Camellia fascicularis]
MLGYKFLVFKLKKAWGLHGDFEATDLGLGFFLIKFEMQADCSRVYTEGPWIIMDHYLTVRRWEPDFKPSETGEVATALWVRFPQLPIEHYNEKVLFHIAKAIGKPLKIDLNTVMSARGRYARVCVEVDLTMPLISRFAIGKYTYVVEYEHIYYFCFQCGKVGHKKEYCSSKSVPESAKVHTETLTNGHDVGSNQTPTASSSGKQIAPGAEHSDEFGPWMLVNRRTNRPNFTGRQSGPNTATGRRSTNRFGPLAKNGNREGPTDRAKHQNPMGPNNEGAYGKESSSEAGNPNVIQRISSERQHDGRQLNTDKTTPGAAQARPENTAASPIPSLVQTTSEDSTRMIADPYPPNPSSPFNPAPVQISAPTSPPPFTSNLQISSVSFEIKQKPPDTNIEHLQHHRGSGATNRSNHPDESQLGGLIPRTRERSHSPSKRRLVDRRDKDEHRAQMGERGRKTTTGNTDGSSKVIRAIQEDCT